MTIFHFFYHFNKKLYLRYKSNKIYVFNFFLLQRWPTEVPELQSAVKSLFDLLSRLGDRVLSAMAIGLGLVSTCTVK